MFVACAVEVGSSRGRNAVAREFVQNSLDAVIGMFFVLIVNAVIGESKVGSTRVRPWRSTAFYIPVAKVGRSCPPGANAGDILSSFFD